MQSKLHMVAQASRAETSQKAAAAAAAAIPLQACWAGWAAQVSGAASQHAAGLP